jgi:hypothetical protein
MQHRDFQRVTTENKRLKAELQRIVDLYPNTDLAARIRVVLRHGEEP